MTMAQAVTMQDEDVIERQPPGPRVIAGIFKVAVVLAAVVGAFGAIVVGVGDTSTDSVAIAVGLGVGGVFVGAGLAFFGYVLDLLVGSRTTWACCLMSPSGPRRTDPTEQPQSRCVEMVEQLSG